MWVQKEILSINLNMQSKSFLRGDIIMSQHKNIAVLISKTWRCSSVDNFKTVQLI